MPTYRAGDPPKGIVARATLIIDSFDSPYEVLGLDDVAERTGLSSSSAHRLVTQLVESRWIARLRYGYRLGPRALSFVSTPYTSHLELRSASARPLHSLFLRTGTVVRLTVLDGLDELVLDQFSGRYAPLPTTNIGDRNCPCASISGRTLLSVLSPDSLAHLLNSRRRKCENCGPAHARIETDLAFIRRNGGMFVNRGLHPHDAPVAAAVVDITGLPVAAVSLGGRTGTGSARCLALVSEAVETIARNLGSPVNRHSRADGHRGTLSNDAASSQTSN
ncbi:IclR family transcriptional regulator [Nocardiaceae bacterium NPDC056970]